MNGFIVLIDVLIAIFLFGLGRYIIKSKDTERSILFLAGDYSGLDTKKICRVTGKRIQLWGMCFFFGGIMDLIQAGSGIRISAVAFSILLVLHLVDMTINRNSKYRL